jgi:Outer membrane protein and related peptidoglycan-associated (lipo)proteins
LPQKFASNFQGLGLDSIVTKGFGPTAPVGDNKIAAGRQLNRRVEVIVRGEVSAIKSARKRPVRLKGVLPSKRAGGFAASSQR